MEVWVNVMSYKLRDLCRTLFEVALPSEVNIFDFDDTLVHTTSHVYLTTKAGDSLKLTSAEYAVYRPVEGDSFDFSDFELVDGAEPIHHMILKLQYAIRNLGLNNVFILTARGSSKPISRFLDGLGVGGIRVVALGSSDPQSKVDVIRDEILTRGVQIVKFYDDSAKNIAAVLALRQDPMIPRNVQIVATRVK